MEILYQDGRVRLWEEDGNLRFYDGTEDYAVTSYPYEPCLYLTDAGGCRIVIHNSFESDWIASAARESRTLRSITGKEYDIAGLCALLRIAAGEGIDMNIDDAERLYAEEQSEACGAVPGTKEKPAYCIPLKEATLRGRIEEMMKIAGDGPGRRMDLGRLKKLYAAEKVPMLPAGERFLARYAYLFSTLTPGFGSEEDDLRFHFETFDEFLEKERGARLRAAAAQSGRVAEAAGCPVTPAGLYGFGEPLSVYVGENGHLYACGDDSDGVRVYESIVDLYEDVLLGHPPVALDD